MTEEEFLAMAARQLCRKSLGAFIELVAFPSAAPGSQFLPGWHIDAIAHVLEEVAKKKIKRLIITMPPRSLKSICASVAFPAWLLGLNPTARVIVASYGDALARHFSLLCREVMGSRLYREAFPHTRIALKDAENEFWTSNGGFRYSTSGGGPLTGRGGDTIVVDDPLKAADAYSEAARADLQQWFMNTLLSRLDNKSDDCIVIVSQRLHDDDLVGFLLRQGGWYHLNLPAIAENDEQIPLGNGTFHVRQAGDLLQPQREPREVLDDLRRSMGSRDFSAQYQQCPVPPGGNLINPDWFKWFDHPPAVSEDRIIVSCDTAMTSKELSSYSVAIVLHVRGDTVHILDVVRERLDYPDLRRKIIEVHNQWRRVGRSYELLIENKGSGMSLIQDLRNSDIYAIAIDPVGDKIMRMQAQTARIEAGSVFLPRSAPWLDEFKHEICAFPNSRHNDQVDALSQGLDRAFKPQAKVTVVSVLGHH